MRQKLISAASSVYPKGARNPSLEESLLKRIAPLALALTLITAACGGGGDAGAPTETPASGPPLPTLTAQPTTTSSGLQVVDIAVGDGAEASPGSIVYVSYNEWLSDGTFIDTTTVDGQVVTLRLVLRQGLVLQGFVEGIPGMRVGGKRRLIMPPDLAYGAEGSGNAVPPNATLIFDIELVEVRAP